MAVLPTKITKSVNIVCGGHWTRTACAINSYYFYLFILIWKLYTMIHKNTQPTGNIFWNVLTTGLRYYPPKLFDCHFQMHWLICGQSFQFRIMSVIPFSVHMFCAKMFFAIISNNYDFCSCRPIIIPLRINRSLQKIRLAGCRLFFSLAYASSPVHSTALLPRRFWSHS